MDKTMTRTKVVASPSGSVTVELTKEENDARDAEEKAWADKAPERELEAFYNKRKSEYPTIEECVHAILDGELDDLQIKRQVVKDKYPKGDS